MCFSASASFGAGIVLATIGIIAVKKTTVASQLAFSVIPFIFCIQQIAEGFLWLSLTNDAYASFKQAGTYTFLLFAQVVWPVWLPFAIFKMEKDSKRKRIQKIWVVIGAILSAYLAYCLFTYHVEPKIKGSHISYYKVYPVLFNKYCGLLYIIATVTPAFFSSIKKMWTLGAAILVSYIITAIFYNEHIVSVWCFFASLISILVAFILNEIKKERKAFLEKITAFP